MDKKLNECAEAIREALFGNISKQGSALNKLTEETIIEVLSHPEAESYWRSKLSTEPKGIKAEGKEVAESNKSELERWGKEGAGMPQPIEGGWISKTIPPIVPAFTSLQVLVMDINHKTIGGYPVIELAAYRHNEWRTQITTFTHWMPLPPLPPHTDNPIK